jgi:hypothetical protein
MTIVAAAKMGAGADRDPGREHVMRPDDKADDADRDHR